MLLIVTADTRCCYTRSRAAPAQHCASGGHRSAARRAPVAALHLTDTGTALRKLFSAVLWNFLLLKSVSELQATRGPSSRAEDAVPGSAGMELAFISFSNAALWLPETNADK